MNRNKLILKISFINGILVPNDAISNIMRDKINAICYYCECNNIPCKTKIFVQYTELEDSRIMTMNNLNDILKNDHFNSSDLIFYEYGIYYELFNSIVFAHPNAKKIVQYYGITPAKFLPKKDKKIIEQSYEQLNLILLADKIIVYSKHTENDLRDLGVSDKKFIFSTVPVCLKYPKNNVLIQNRKYKTVKLLYVGRFVKSKGVIDLLKAAERLIHSGFKDFQLNLIGSLTYSDTQYVEDIKRFIVLKKLSDFVSFVGTVKDEELCQYYADSDALVIPSYHEGFCVPVIEAYTQGCFVIAYNSGNLPSVVNGFGRIIEAGDIQQLYSALKDYCETKMSNKDGIQEISFKTDSGNIFEKELIDKVKQYASHFTIDCYQNNISNIFKDILTENSINQNLDSNPKNQKLDIINKIRKLFSDIL